MTASLIYAATALAITAMLCLAAGRAWRGWLELKRLELAAVRERLKKLEEIASGVEL